MAQKKHYSIRAYLSYLMRYKYRFLLVVVLFIISNGMLTLIPVFIGRLVSSLAATPPDQDVVYHYTRLLIFCTITHHITWHSAELVYLRLVVGRNHEFGDLLFKSVIEKPYPYFIGKYTGKIGSYVSDLSREYRDFIDNIAYNYLNMLVKMPAIAIIMFSVNVYTGLAFIGGIVMMFLVGRITVRPARRKEKIFTDKNSTLNGYIIDVISNFVSVKAFRRTQGEANHVAAERRKVTRAAKQSFLWNIAFWASMGSWVWVIIWPGTIVLNVWLFLNGHINLAEITTFTTAIVIFADYVWGVAWNISQFNLKLARIEEAYRYLFGKRNVIKEYFQSATANRTSEKPAFKTSLQFQNLSFAYPDDKQTAVLKDLNLQLSKNEKVGVVGRSGSGKTTLIKVLLGYYQVPTGTVLVDDVPIDNRQLISLISYVPQDTSLFHRSITDNIAYGTDETPAQDVIEAAAKRAHAHEFITKTPQGYATLVGEKGVKLSTGQRQRVAIARAFLDNKPLLILDEATSALDSESEVLVQQALEDLWQDKTVIAIAHRLSTLRNMDRIVVMDKGRIIEAGTHEQLIKLRGHYYRLWQHQSGGLIGDE